MSVFTEIRISFRSLLRKPTLVAAVVLTLAIGIAASAGMISLLDALTSFGLPYPRSSQIVRLYGPHPQSYVLFGPRGFEIAPRELAGGRSFIAIGAYVSGSMNLGDFPAERVRVAAVTPTFFRVLEVQPTLGRLFSDSDIAAGADDIAVISASVWRTRFGGSEDIFDKSLQLNSRRFRIVGVMPERATFPNNSDAWIPPARAAQLSSGVSIPIVVARLQGGASIASATEDVRRILYSVSGVATDALQRVEIRKLADVLVGDLRPIAFFLFAAASLVLVVATINVVGLLLTHGLSVQHEFAVRATLGASKVSLAKRVFYDTAWLVLLSAVVALPLIGWSFVGLHNFLPSELSSLLELRLDGRFLLLLTFVVLPVAVTCAFPATLAVRYMNMAGLLKDLSAAAPAKVRLRGGIAIAQVAITVTILASVLMLSRSLASLVAVDMGVAADGLLTAELTLPRVDYPSRGAALLFVEALSARLDDALGAGTTAVSNRFVGPDAAAVVVENAILGSDTSVARRTALYQWVTANYFQAAGIPLVVGRPFAKFDTATSARVAVVSERFAHEAGIPPAEIIGRQVNVDPGYGARTWAEIVGVVKDVRYDGPASQPTASLYVPASQSMLGMGSLRILAKSALGPATTRDRIRAAVQQTDSRLPLYDVRTVRELIDSMFRERSLMLHSMSVFAAIALLLTAIGLYGLSAYQVQVQQHELCIRLALGAPNERLALEVLRRSLTHTASGIGAGLLLVLAFAPLLRSRIDGLEQLDVAILSITVFVVAAIGTAASLAPAFWTWRLDPISRLRSQ